MGGSGPCPVGKATTCSRFMLTRHTPGQVSMIYYLCPPYHTGYTSFVSPQGVCLSSGVACHLVWPVIQCTPRLLYHENHICSYASYTPPQPDFVLRLCTPLGPPPSLPHTILHPPSPIICMITSELHASLCVSSLSLSRPPMSISCPPMSISCPAFGAMP